MDHLTRDTGLHPYPGFLRIGAVPRGYPLLGFDSVNIFSFCGSGCQATPCNEYRSPCKRTRNAVGRGRARPYSCFTSSVHKQPQVYTEYLPDDYVRRAAITRLPVDGEQRDSVEETITEWKRRCQIATDLAWGRCNDKSDVQLLACGYRWACQWYHNSFRETPIHSRYPFIQDSISQDL